MNLTTGQQLKAARLSRDLTLQDVAHETRIPVTRLQQLEEDNFAAFGAISYARSFLQEYGRFLDVDVKSVTESLPPPVLGGSADYRYLTESLGPWVAGGRQKAASTRPARATAPRRKSPKSTILTLSALFAIMAVLWGVWVEKLSAKNPATVATQPEQQAPAESDKSDDFSAFRQEKTAASETPSVATVGNVPRAPLPVGVAPRPEIVKDDEPAVGQKEIILKPAAVVVKKPEIVE
jgi:cytoskeletal protein RodZ